MRRWIRLAAYLFIVTTLIFQVHADYWSIWTGWSECSRTCDGGATFQLRRCIRSRRFAKSCQGETIRYATCNNEPCDLAVDFRASQCSAHDSEPYSGRYITWIPYLDTTSPCALYCQPVGEKLVHLFAPKVLDGTRCGNNSLDMCINGKCWPVGCDHVLGSTKRMDKCGVCGGTDTCEHDTTTGIHRYMWDTAGYSQCSATCGVGFQVLVVVCRDKLTNVIVREESCLDRKPDSHTIECHHRVCYNTTVLFRWMVGPWRDCTQTCGGGFSWRIVRCVHTFLDGTQQIVDGEFCSKHAPSRRKSCNNQICPTWYAGQWTPCGVTCGSGIQTRDVVCRHVGDEYCDKKVRPRTLKNCSTHIPCFDQNDAGYAEFYRQDIQEVMTDDKVEGTSDKQLVITDGRFAKEYITSPRFVVSKWGPCSASCGQGTKWRFVRCKVYLPFSNKDSLTDLADSECSGDKPVESLLCDSEPCYDQYEYRAIGFTACSRSCLGGVQETIVRCVHKENGTVMEDFLCGDKSPPPIARRICNDIICPQRWKVSDFGACSVTCGSGTMIRGVECIQEFASGYQNVIRLPDYMCEQPVPARARICFREECKAEWSVGNWSECTATCGSGITIRDVFCTRVLSLGLTMNVTLKECDLSLKPEATKMCNNRKCPKPKIKALDIKFFQLDKMKKVKLTIGMNADILPDTTIVLKCPTRGLNPYHIQWYKNGVLIEPRIGKRIKVNSKMHLKIKRSLPIVDDGIYSCKVGSLMASSTISYSNVYDIFSATLMRKRFISGSGPAKLIQRDLGLGSLTQRDPVSRRRRPLRLVEGPWNPCSATCGGGLQSRNVSCEIITQDYYEVFPVRYCTKAGYMEPTLIQSCNTHPCVEWKTSNWSECSLQTCVRNMFSYQSRDVVCVMQHSNITLNTSECDQLGAMPPSEKECVNENCMALWNVSKWTECIGKCGTKGFKSRMLNCIWSKTGLPAGRLCDPSKRPITTKNCHVKPCSEACIDKSKYCSVVKLLDFCRLVNFSRNCCVSCGGQSSGDNKYARRKRRKLAV